MKKVYVKLEGWGPVYHFDDLWDPENYDKVPIDDCDYDTLVDNEWLEGAWTQVAVILKGVKVSVYESMDDEDVKDITRMKGKYILANNYFSDILGFRSPFYFHQINTCHIEECFTIHLEDDEEFDPKKLQLIKSDYELAYISYAIITSYIMYDGKMYFTRVLDGYSGECEIRLIYNEKQPYGSSNRAISLSRDMIVKQEEEE